MVKASKAKEVRQRDVKRNRVVLSIGNKSYHLTQAEVKKLAKELANLTE